MIVYNVCPACGNKNIQPVFSARDHTVSHESFEIWECKECTLRFTQNIPEIDAIGKYYQSDNYISHSDTAKGFINNLYHKVRKRTLGQKKNLVSNITGKNSGKILDVGCGTGAFLQTMKISGWDITGLEPDENARNKAIELYNIHPLPANAFYGLPDHSFDAITLWHVLEHVHDLHGYMKKFKNLLAPGGKLFIAVPNYTSYDAGFYKEFWAAYDVPRHLYHFSPKAMKSLWVAHGLRVQQMKPMWFDSVYVSMLSEKYKKGPSHAAVGFFSGTISNLKAMMNVERCSSVIYCGEESKQ